MIARVLHFLGRTVQLALLRARLAQLNLARSHIALTHPTDRVLHRRLDAHIALVGLEITVLKAQP